MNIQEHKEIAQVGPMSPAEISLRMKTMQIRDSHAPQILKAIGVSLVRFFEALHRDDSGDRI